MKKLISSIIMTAILAIAVPTFAQTRYCDDNGRSRRTSTRYYSERQQYYGNQYYGDPYYRSNTGVSGVYNRHRKAANIAIGTGAGALIGAFLGGKKGALIGAGAGAAGGFIMTKKQAPRNYYRRY
jgi:hypothetical protein